MDNPPKKTKQLIPKKAQIPLLVAGFFLMAFVAVSTARQMGWISDVPHAKRVAAKPKPQPGGPAGTPAATPGSPATTPAGPTGTRLAAAPNLESINLPGRDPMDSGAGAGPKPPGGTPPPGGEKPPLPAGVPPLPPPMPAPGTPGGFPSPTTGPGGAGAPSSALPPGLAAPAVKAPVPRPLPPALAASYPVLRRGRSAPPAPTVSLVGTISGPRGALAVVRGTDTATSRGRYLRPGDTLDPAGHRVKAIAPGTLTVTGRGGTQQLHLAQPKPPTVPAPPPAASETGGAPAGLSGEEGGGYVQPASVDAGTPLPQ